MNYIFFADKDSKSQGGWEGEEFIITTILSFCINIL